MHIIIDGQQVGCVTHIDMDGSHVVGASIGGMPHLDDIISGPVTVTGTMNVEYVLQDFWWTPPAKPRGWSRSARRGRRRIEKMIKLHRRKWKRKFVFRADLS